MVRVLSKQHRAHVEALEIGGFRMAVISRLSAMQSVISERRLLGSQVPGAGCQQGNTHDPQDSQTR